MRHNRYFLNYCSSAYNKFSVSNFASYIQSAFFAFETEVLYVSKLMFLFLQKTSCHNCSGSSENIKIYLLKTQPLFSKDKCSTNCEDSQNSVKNSRKVDESYLMKKIFLAAFSTFLTHNFSKQTATQAAIMAFINL